MSINPHHIVYFLEMTFGQLAMVLEADGNAGVWMSCNHRERQEIGFYGRRFPPNVFEHVQAQKAQSGLERVVQPTETMPPGTLTTSIGETTDGKTYDLRGFILGQVPASAKPLFEEAQRIAESVLAHPRRVLGGKGTPEAPTFRPEDPLRFVVTFRGVGTDPLKMANNFAGSPSNPKWTGVSLTIVRDSPAGKHEDDPLHIELAPQNLRVDGVKPGSTQGNWLVLAPGDELHLAIRRKVHASPGRYRAKVDCIFSQQDDLSALDGTLTIDLGTFEIVRGGKA
jgi:hypothetical protein